MWSGNGGFGTNGDGLIHYNELVEFDFETEHWVQLDFTGTPPKPTEAHRVISCGKYMYLFGGHDGTIFFNNLYRYDCELKHWTKYNNCGNIPRARSCPAIDFLPQLNAFIMIGGFGPKTKKERRSTEGDWFLRFSDIYIAKLTPTKSN